MTHPLGSISNDAPVTVPLQRTPDMDWPGNAPVVNVPAALMLAAHGRCSCDSCLDGFVRLLARSRMRAV